ncbi:MAG TPA: Uma2 family endonuclease [Longimicrobiaceae bacterium]|nr:Uma2 family endonuclease [Longimicrobiaceae bacterium]
MSNLLDEIRRDDWSGEPGEIKVVPLDRAATIADLALTKLKAEIVDGQLLVIGPSGCAPARASEQVAMSLRDHERPDRPGRAFMSRVSYLVDLPHRTAICPDASWYTGPRWKTGFPRVAPIFAVEVRDESEYGPAEERRLTAKRADYFAAGTQVVWDVDVLREGVVRVYRATDPENPTVYRRGEVAEAEPAVPGWRMPVDDLYE